MSILTLLFSSACVQEKTKTEPQTASPATEAAKNKEPQPATNPISKESVVPPFIIETFTEFPPEIDGCSCYFSNDKSGFEKQEFIYANNYDKTSFIKINGTFVKFIQTKSYPAEKEIRTEKYTSDNYEMTIDITDGERSGDETFLKSGTITLTDKDGNTIIKKFYGECGC